MKELRKLVQSEAKYDIWYTDSKKARKSQNLEGIDEAMSVLSPLKLEEDSIYKDILFYYIILSMQSFSLLNRLYTHYLEEVFEKSLEDQEKASGVIRKLRRYPLTSKPPGICFIFSMHTKRGGAASDTENVQQYFERELHYDTITYIDPTKTEIRQAADKLKTEINRFYDRYGIVSSCVFFQIN